MLICALLVLPVYVTLLILIPIITQVVQMVCNWVSSVIQVVTQVLSQVCPWVPWPLSIVCNWVTTAVTALQTVWNYVCTTVVQTIILWITQAVSLLLYVTRIVCTVINIIWGLPALLLCLLGLSPRKRLRVCVKILTDEKDQSAVTPAAITQNIQRIVAAYSECNIEVILIGIERIVKPEYLTTTTSSFWGLFTPWHLWFTLRACFCCNQVTVFVVDKIQGAGGLTFWGDSWCRVDSDCNVDDSVMAHEIGHLLNLWHVNDPNNVMYPTTVIPVTSHHFTPFQCCWVKRSPFTTYF